MPERKGEAGGPVLRSTGVFVAAGNEDAWGEVVERVQVDIARESGWETQDSRRESWNDSKARRAGKACSGRR